MMGQSGKGKNGFKEQRQDKGWVNRRRDDEVLRKGNMFNGRRKQTRIGDIESWAA